MSWPSASSAGSFETRPFDTRTTEPEQRDPENIGQRANNRDRFGAFRVPGSGSPLEARDWLARNRHESEEHVQNCDSCGTPTKELRRLGCDHLWDRSCLLARIELALRWEGNWPAKCCQKIDDAEMKALAPFLGEDIVERYLERCLEMETPRDRRTYCANTLCSVFVGQRTTGAHLDTCSKCNTLTCLACGNKDGLHDHDECPSDTTAALREELVRSGNLQQCPGCPEVIELREACNHITCVCGTEFCFSCGAFWRTCLCNLYPDGEIAGEEEEGQEEGAAETEQTLAAARAICLHPVFNNATRRARCEYCGYSYRTWMYICARCRIATCRGCYDRLNLFAIGASALRQEAALVRADRDREDELGD